MNRFKLVCIGIVVIITTMIMCSCINKAEASPKTNNFSIIKVYNDPAFNIYKVNTPHGTVYVGRSAHGLCTLN